MVMSLGPAKRFFCSYETAKERQVKNLSLRVRLVAPVF